MEVIKTIYLLFVGKLLVKQSIVFCLNQPVKWNTEIPNTRDIQRRHTGAQHMDWWGRGGVRRTNILLNFLEKNS
jgi:hypothetical protein